MVVMRTVVPTLVAASLVGGLIGAGVMSAAHAVMSKASRLADPGPKEDDATVKVADAVARHVRGHRIAEDAKPLASALRLRRARGRRSRARPRPLAAAPASEQGSGRIRAAPRVRDRVGLVWRAAIRIAI